LEGLYSIGTTRFLLRGAGKQGALNPGS
jgi:hypothetical protein